MFTRSINNGEMSEMFEERLKIDRKWQLRNR